MAKGSLILINGVQPNGRFVSGIVSGAPYPGMQLEMKPATEPVNGLFTYRACSAQAPKQCPFILLEDENQGGSNTLAYADGYICRMYVPIPGDELNLLFQNITGTADAFAIGAVAIVDSDGKFIATTGTPASVHVQVEETVAALTVDTLIACRWF